MRTTLFILSFPIALLLMLLWVLLPMILQRLRNWQRRRAMHRRQLPPSPDGLFTTLPEITPHLAARRDLMRQNIFNALNHNKTAH